MSALIMMILTLAIIGFLVYLIITYIPMPEIFKQVIIVAVVIAAVLWLLQGNMGFNFK